MRAIKIKNLLVTINEFKDECYLNGNISQIFQLREVEEQLTCALQKLE